MSEVIERSGKVHVKPFRKTWLPEGHDGETRYTSCAEFLAVPISMASGEMVTGLTEFEERQLEEELLLQPKTLSKYNKEFWGAYKQMIRMDRYGLTLDLSKPWDYIKYKNLLVNPKVAPNEAQKLDSPEFEYVLTSVEAEAKFKNQINKVKKNAYTKFDKLTISDKKNILKMYGHRIDDSYSEEIIDSKLFDYIEKEPQTFLDKLEDPDFKMKVFISDCLHIGAMKKNGSKYMINGGETIGLSLAEVISYLGDPNNQDVYVSLKAQLEVAGGVKIKKKAE